MPKSQARAALSELSGIPKEKIAGFRAPYLKYNGQGFQVVFDQHFLYDSSVTDIAAGLSKGSRGRLWPYTLDYGIAQKCFTGICPEKNYPGLFEIPIYAMLSKNSAPVAMDPEGGEGRIFELWQENFYQHRQGNHSPFGIYLHGAWLKNDSHRAALERFLEWVQQQDDVWFVTMQDILGYMRHPVPARRMEDFLKCPVSKPGLEVCDGRDNNSDGRIDEGLVKTCKYNEDTFRTCGKCPDQYPAVKAK